MGTFPNSEDPVEMRQNVAFHQGLHCLQRQTFLYITCSTSIYTMNHSGFIISSFMENSIGQKRVSFGVVFQKEKYLI